MEKAITKKEEKSIVPVKEEVAVVPVREVVDTLRARGLVKMDGDLLDGLVALGSDANLVEVVKAGRGLLLTTVSKTMELQNKFLKDYDSEDDPISRVGIAQNLVALNKQLLESHKYTEQLATNLGLVKTSSTPGVQVNIGVGVGGVPNQPREIRLGKPPTQMRTDSPSPRNQSPIVDIPS